MNIPASAEIAHFATKRLLREERAKRLCPCGCLVAVHPSNTYASHDCHNRHLRRGRYRHLDAELQGGVR